MHKLITLAPRILLAIALIITSLNPPALYGVTAIEAWAQRYNGPGNGDDHPSAVAVDPFGNILVTGTAQLDGYAAMATIKYSKSGLPLWTNLSRSLANSHDSAVALAVDAAGNVFVTGSSTNSLSAGDFLTLAYSPEGLPLWTNRFDGPANGLDAPMAIAVDSNGEVIVTGHSAGIGTGQDFVTIKYSNSGIPLWTNRHENLQNREDRALALTIANSGRVFVTGTSTFATDSGIKTELVTIAYSGTGEPVWTNQLTTMPEAMAVDADGNVFIAGLTITGGFTLSALTIAYSELGTPLWTNLYNGGERSRATAIAVDTTGNVYVTGYSFTWATLHNYASIKYSRAGVPLWTNVYSSPGRQSDWPVAIGVDQTGCVFVTGYSCQEGYGPEDFLTIAYSTTGTPLWTNRYNSPHNLADVPMNSRSLVLAGNGAPIVIGQSKSIHGSSTNYDFALVQFVSVPTAVSILQKSTGTNELVFSGMPETEYITQFSTNVLLGPWLDFSTNTAAPDSFWKLNDCTATNASRFYRAVGR
ncbi:MAG TPA: SBBP repeat-containing protein [Clostridia bacterium]|nr:SBBP repeat-containing protein [Clostridia bacterium]